MGENDAPAERLALCPVLVSGWSCSEKPKMKSSKCLVWRGKCAIFTVATRSSPNDLESVSGHGLGESADGRVGSGVWRRTAFGFCTKTGHRLVDGVHSIENTCTYEDVFLIDEKNRKSRTESFFDSF